MNAAYIDAITFKQMEALYWSARLGTFASAATQLNATQSAVAKRVRELENALGLTLFHRRGGAIELTSDGEEMVTLAKEALAIKRRFRNAASHEHRHRTALRIGVTDLTAMTWLADWLRLLQDVEPRIDIIPSVNLSARLFADLLRDDLDMIVVPDAFPHPHLERIPLADVPNDWLVSPGCGLRLHMPLEEIARSTVITQSSDSGTGRILNSWLTLIGVELRRPILASNLGAIISLSVAGLGIGILPRPAVADLISERQLVPVHSYPALPAVTYVALYRGGGGRDLLAATIVTACDFDRTIRGKAQAGHSHTQQNVSQVLT